MNIETVNELIASLESAGELSIGERKYLELAKEFRICSTSLDAAIKTGNVLADQNSQLAAENVGLKAGVQAALDEMESHHDTDALYSYDADGEPMDALIRLCDAQGTISDLLSMNETPATDRIVAGIKADVWMEAKEFTKSMLASDSVDHLDFLFDGKIQQLREGADK
ncbi:TPA: hypothetical protein ACHTHW_000837 [Klebsiella pneumoniae]|uniref:hypothetical protein n=1 Tax=Klebsiella sp. K5-309 TaxID=2866565 RepID=UPI0024DF2484|nr:hypothetical protein [Klebsiella sp. K5-309]MDK1795468.1 hypothetical protein [Klebsiella sp. K5-309]HCL5839091.1 hypothetical protein [Klebsiella pneumoniae]